MKIGKPIKTVTSPPRRVQKATPIPLNIPVSVPKKEKQKQPA